VTNKAPDQSAGDSAQLSALSHASHGAGWLGHEPVLLVPSLLLAVSVTNQLNLLEEKLADCDKANPRS
jgi:hypothetical protein